MTAGIISVKARDLNPYDASNQSFIQTDAAVNSGNSGVLGQRNGDLIASTQQSPVMVWVLLLGILLQCRVSHERSMKISSNMVVQALLGVSGNGINNRFSKDYDLDTTEGFYIANVEDGMGAKEAGLQAEDIIVEDCGQYQGAILCRYDWLPQQQTPWR